MTKKKNPVQYQVLLHNVSFILEQFFIFVFNDWQFWRI
jgi:hypothetical protein